MASRASSSRPVRTVIGALLLAVAVVGGLGCSSGSDGSAEPTNGGDANPTTPAGEGAGGGPAPVETTAGATSLPEGDRVEVVGTLSGVRDSPDQAYYVCTYLTTPDGVLALDFDESSYEVISNVEPIQHEINDAATGTPVARLGDEVTVDGVQHPEATPLAGQPLTCEGATAYLTVVSMVTSS